VRLVEDLLRLSGHHHRVTPSFPIDSTTAGCPGASVGNPKV